VIILTKKKSMGTPKSQRIRMDGPSTPSGPLISEICPAQANDLKPRSRVPKYKIRGEPAKGKLLRMVAELNLPDVVIFARFLLLVLLILFCQQNSSEELTVDIGEDRILMEAHKSNYKLDVYLPRTVDQDGATAQFNKDSKVNTDCRIALLFVFLLSVLSFKSSKYLCMI
jgi:PIH1 CS-like domain